jgi:hypothetical protein
MLVERLKVRFTRDDIVHPCNSGLLAGTGHQSLPPGIGDPSDIDQNVNVVYDFCSETPQISSPTLPRSAGIIRNMARF